MEYQGEIMPTYEITSPSGKVYEVDAPEGATEAEVMDYARSQFANGPEAPESTYAERAGRGLGLGTRAVATGLTGLPAMIGDAANTVMNFIPGVDLQMPSQMLQQGMTNVGLPEPETPDERMMQGAIAGGAGVLPSMGTGLMANIPALAAMPKYQAMSGLMGGGAGAYAAEQGMGPMGQMGMSLLGGIAPQATGTAFQAGMNALRIPQTAQQLLSQQGHRNIAGGLLRDAADGPAVIPDDTGLMTTGQATRNLGLRSMEKTLRGQDDVAFGLRDIDQNLDIQNRLSSIAGTEDDIARMTAARNDAGRAARSQVIGRQQQPVNTEAIDAVIRRELAGEAGERELARSALRGVRSRLTEEVDGEQVYKTDMTRVYGIRKHINDLLEGRGENPASRYASQELMRVKNVLDEVMEEAGPGWNQYLSDFAEASRDINRLDTLQNIQARATTAVPHVTENAVTDIISRPKWKTMVTSRLDDLDLNANQRTVIEAITADLDATAPPPALRQAGSDTARNISALKLLSNILPPSTMETPFVQKLMRPMSFLLKQSDEDIKRILVEASLDPSFARRLMMRGNEQNMREISYMLLDKMKSGSIGSASGMAASMNTIEGEQ